MPPYSNGDSLFIGRHYRPQQRVFATLDPLTASGGVTLSADLLTMTRNAPGASWRSIRSTIAQTSGRWFFEVTNNGPASNGKMLGTVDATQPATSPPGAVVGVPGQGYQEQPAPANPLTWLNGSFGSVFPIHMVPGDVMGVAVNQDTRQVFTILNGVTTVPNVLTGNTPLTAVYACIALFSTGDSLTVNFGASPFAFPASVPAGYNAGWWV